MTSGGTGPEMAELGSYFTHISTLLASGKDTHDPHRLVDLAARVIPHARICGVTLLRPARAPETTAASDPLVYAADALQYQLREGPCLDAAEGDGAVVSDDLQHEDRWPLFGPRCAEEVGVRSMLGVQVVLPGAERAALNFYATDVGAFDDLDIGVASILAPFAAMTLSHALRAEETASLSAALGSSRQIGTAIGILMVRYGVPSADAFALLRTASQHLNRKLRDIADEVTWTGDLPDHPQVRPAEPERTP